MPASFMAEENIPFTSLMFHIEDLAFEDDLGVTMTARAFYSRLKSGETITTTQVNPASCMDFFSEFLDQGLDILHIAFSSALSGSCASAQIAAAELKPKYPGRKVVVVDSLCASMGQGLLLTHAVRLKKGGAALEEVAAWLEENKLHLCHFFTVNDLFHLCRGGRVSKTSAVLGSLIGIKPILHVDDEGRLVPIGKCRGRATALSALADHMERHAVDPKKQTVYISHGDCLEDAEFLAATIRRRLGVKDILINPVGPVIGSHAGQGVVALFFIGDKR